LDSISISGEDMRKKHRDTKGISALNDKNAYQFELGAEQERIRRKKASDALKESEKREALEKAGQGNLFTTQKRE
jgi:DNA polymerase III delta prime subunit